LPFVIIPGVAAIFLLMTHAFYLLKDGFRMMFNMYSVNFDIWTFIKDFRFAFNILDMNFITISISIFMLILVSIILISSHRHTNEKVLKHGVFPLCLYVGTFHLVLAFMWVGIAIDMLRGKMQKW